MDGWIKLHRQITGNEFYFSERFTKAQAWIDLLLLACHTTNTLFIRGLEINLNPGEMCYSQLSLSKRWKWNDRTVNRYLKLLENRQMIQTRINNVTSIITILNWTKYQSSTEQNTERVQCRIQTNKKDKKDKNIYTSENTGRYDRSTCLVDRFAEFWSLYPKKVGKKKAQQAFLKIKDIDNNITEIIKGLNSYIQSDQWFKDGGQYIPHPSTWLTQERWKDELPAQSAGVLMDINSFGRSSNRAWKIIKLRTDY